MKLYAKEIEGNFSEYDDQISVIVAHQEMERQQAMVGEIDKKTTLFRYHLKVCVTDDKIQFKELLKENHKSIYGKFTIANDFLKVESRTAVNEVTEETLEIAIQEIAKLADR